MEKFSRKLCQNRLISIKEVIFQILRISSVLLVFYLLVKTYYVAGLIFGLILTMSIVFLIILYFYRKEFGFLSKKDGVAIDKKRVLIYNAKAFDNRE